MIANLITIEDLDQFRVLLLDEIKKLYFQKHPQATRKWLKSHEVRRILAISPGSLQNMRVNGQLPFTKIGGIIYYDAEDIDRMLTNNKRVDERHPFSLEKRALFNKATLLN